MSDAIEQAARVLSQAWGRMHTNESLGRQRMLAGALADAGLLARTLPTRDEIVDVLSGWPIGTGYYQTTIEFRPTLRAQAEHAERNQQTDRAAIFNRLLDSLPAETS